MQTNPTYKRGVSLQSSQFARPTERKLAHQLSVSMTKVSEYYSIVLTQEIKHVA